MNVRVIVAALFAVGAFGGPQRFHIGGQSPQGTAAQDGPEYMVHLPQGVPQRFAGAVRDR
jgi:hypothetical protein